MRYAIYCTPAPGSPLLTAVEPWFGRSAFGYETSTDTGPFSVVEHATLTATRARYGFHATLKAPFHLAGGYDHHTLLQSFTAFASRSGPIDVGQLQISTFGRYLALTPAHQPQTLTDFAQTVVEAFEPARAPLSQDDFARRNTPDLTNHQRNLLSKWGYASTQDCFTFHMTLAGPTDLDLLQRAKAYLQDKLGPALEEPFVLDTLGLFQEAAPPGTFDIIQHAPLSGTDTNANR